MLKTIELTKVYEDGVVALDHLDLEVAPGEIYCLLGANGAGKTTTINLFLNFIEPTSGQALIHGVDVQQDPLEAKKHVAFLSENVSMYPHFTARQNLDFFARLAGRSDLSRDEALAVLKRVGLQQSAFEQKVQAFSKGMRQKLGIAVAVIKQAPALILDEPLSGLDPKAASELLEILSDLRDEGRAILMSTHDVFRARALADRVGIMREGRKATELTADELRSQDLEKLYLSIMSDAAPQPEKPVPAVGG